jgi:HlyD family secretion protein
MTSELDKLRISKEHRAPRDAKSRWPIVLGILVLIGAGVGITQWRGASGATVVKTFHVTPVQASGGDNDRIALNATGYIMAAHKIELASKVIGRVAWVGVEMGDKVTKGQVLVRLEDDEYKARVAQEQGQLDNARAKLAELEAGSRPEEIAQAIAEVDRAKASLENSKSNLDRLKQLASDHYLSRQELDDAETLVRVRQADLDSRQQTLAMARQGPRKEQIDAQRAVVRQLEARLTQASLDLENTVITSPVDATILSRNVEVGEFVTNGFVGDRGAKGYVMSIADLNDLRVELDISQNDFAKISAKQPCFIVTDAYPDRKYDGIVDLISPEANRQKATVLVRVKVLNPDNLLKPDMNATVSFLAPQAPATTHEAAAAQKPSIRIPTAAIRDGAVFTVEDGKAIKHPVTLGATLAGGQVEVHSGLVGGEEIVLSPSDKLAEGDAVKIEPATK